MQLISFHFRNPVSHKKYNTQPDISVYAYTYLYRLHPLFMIIYPKPSILCTHICKTEWLFYSASLKAAMHLYLQLRNLFLNQLPGQGCVPFKGAGVLMKIHRHTAAIGAKTQALIHGYRHIAVCLCRQIQRMLTLHGLIQLYCFQHQ